MNKYLPFLIGKYSTEPGLQMLAKAEQPEDRLVFQIDENYRRFFENKLKCREENIGKYYLECDLQQKTCMAIDKFLINRLLQEHSSQFVWIEDGVLKNQLTDESIEFDKDFQLVKSKNYGSVFDALCSQVQEDLAVVQLTDDSEYLAAIHLCSPNHWSPADKIGRPFAAIHEPVAGMEKTLKNYRPMLDSIVRSPQIFTRFAWGIATDDRLNHHPEPPKGISSEEWNGRQVQYKNQNFFLRVERQNLIGFKEQNAFLFTIRTFFYPIHSLSTEEKRTLWTAVSTMPEASLDYKGLTKLLPDLKSRLFQ